MPIIGLQPEVTREYIPEFGNNRKEAPEDRVVAIFRPLPAAADAELMSELGIKVDYSALKDMKGGKKTREEIEDKLSWEIDPAASTRKGLAALRHSLVKLHNFKVRTAEGGLESFESDVEGDGRQSDRFLDAMPRGLRTELATQALAEEAWTEEEVGKSEPSSSEPTEPAEPSAASAEDRGGKTSDGSGDATDQ